MKYSHIIFIANSDVGVRHTIGSRVWPIVQEVEQRGYTYTVFCRDYDSDVYPFFVVRVVPFGRVIMRILSALPMLIHSRLRTERIKNRLFEFFLIKKLKKINLSDVQIIHSWDFLPHVYAFIATTHPHIQIIQDVPMALHVSLKQDYCGKKISSVSIPSYIKESFSYIHTFIAPSQFVEHSLISIGIDKKNVTVIPFGVDIDIFRPIEKKNNQLFKVVFVGAINMRKGIPYLIDAWRQLNLDNAELHVYGRVYREMLPFVHNAEQDHIYIHGFVDIVDVLPYHDIYVFPSLLEGSAKSVYEALACGLPVITTPNAGSIVTNAHDGYIIDVQNVKMIKEKILFFYRHPEKVKEFGVAARRTAEAYTWQNYAKKVVAEYNNCL
ncbi:MAG: glycosyltransferase family 4 protein [Candidatus Magasanikbacteria bacterium]|nr:glycosyltransferase family 4 protein [Candidatus Magasanikbacteria bacterium]